MRSCFGGLVLSAAVCLLVFRGPAPVCAADAELMSRLIAPASGWEVSSEGMFRINDCRGLLSAYSGALEKKAAAFETPDFSVSFGIKGADSEEVCAVRYSGGRVEVSAQRMEPHIELDAAEAVRLFLGGPPGPGRDCGPLRGLLPLPLHIPLLDRV